MNPQTSDLEKTYSQSDLEVIAFLLARGCGPSHAVKSQDAKQTVFVHFFNPEKCRKLEADFRTKNPKIGVHDLNRGRKAALDIIFAEKNKYV